MVPLDSHDDTGKGDNPRHTRCGWFYLVLLMTPRQAEEVVPFVMLGLEDEFCFWGFGLLPVLPGAMLAFMSIAC